MPASNVLAGITFAPARERGLKHQPALGRYGRLTFAPARERGLKHLGDRDTRAGSVRSRAGAWIETPPAAGLLPVRRGFAPARERGLKPARSPALGPGDVV